MLLTPLWSRLLAIVVAFLLIAVCTNGAPAAKSTTPVEVWRGGDDGLTQRLAAALEDAFRSSPYFTLSTGKKPGTLVVTIPTNVGWKQVGGRTLVRYAVEFASTDNQSIGRSRGSCWDGALGGCAIHIVRDARIAARKVR
jgi:hypothetical protein